jgi:hypothetical protein
LTGQPSETSGPLPPALTLQLHNENELAAAAELLNLFYVLLDGLDSDSYAPVKRVLHQAATVLDELVQSFRTRPMTFAQAWELVNRPQERSEYVIAMILLLRALPNAGDRHLQAPIQLHNFPPQRLAQLREQLTDNQPDGGDIDGPEGLSRAFTLLMVLMLQQHGLVTSWDLQNLFAFILLLGSEREPRLGSLELEVAAVDAVMQLM